MDYENSKSSSHQLVSPWTQVLLSISVISFIYLYSQYSSWCSFLLHSLKFYLSAIPLHALDKRWIFLIFNGILVVLANTSGLVCALSSEFDFNDMIQNKIGDHGLHTPPNMKDESLSEGEVLLPATAEQSGNAVSEEEGQKIENDGETKEEEEEEKGDSMSLLEEDHDHEEQGPGGDREAEAEDVQTYYLDDDHEEQTYKLDDAHEEQEPTCGFLKLEEGEEGEPEAEEIPTRNYILEDDNQVNVTSSETDFLWEEKVKVEDEQMEKLSTEELNKKFEDFIRKMKEEIRIEALQQLVVVK